VTNILPRAGLIMASPRLRPRRQPWEMDSLAVALRSYRPNRVARACVA